MIGDRESLDLDMEKLMDAAREKGCFMEVNAQSERLDLNDIHCRMVKESGVKVAISTDAHTLNDLGNMRFAASGRPAGAGLSPMTCSTGGSGRISSTFSGDRTGITGWKRWT